jgi:hypothetical protein
MPKPKTSPAGDRRQPRQSPIAKRLAELELTAGADGLVAIEMLMDASGKGFSYVRNEQPRCEPGRAIVLVSRAYARPAQA